MKLIYDTDTGLTFALNSTGDLAYQEGQPVEPIGMDDVDDWDAVTDVERFDATPDEARIDAALMDALARLALANPVPR